jgi:CRISPR-associated protein Cas1
MFKTQIDPTISYLHEPFERRYSFNLDLADIFKPLIVDRVIFSLINQKMINETHFDKNLNYCYLNAEGRKIFLREYDKKLNTTIKYPKLNRKVSYRYMLRLECYKLIKHLLKEENYNSFKIYW